MSKSEIKYNEEMRLKIIDKLKNPRGENRHVILGIMQQYIEENRFGLQSYLDKEIPYDDAVNSLAEKLETHFTDYAKHRKDEMIENITKDRAIAYQYISTVISKSKKDSIDIRAQGEIDKIDEKTQTKISYLDKDGNKRYEKVKANSQYFKNKNYFDNIVKRNGKYKEFLQKAKIGLYGPRFGRKLTVIDYNNFQESFTINVMIDGEEKTAEVTIYVGLNGRKTYIIEWVSKNDKAGVEILTDAEYQARGYEAYTPKANETIQKENGKYVIKKRTRKWNN